MSNIHALVLHVEQLIKQNQLLQQENQSLRAQTAEQEEKLAALELNDREQGFSAEDEEAMGHLISLIDENLGEPVSSISSEAQEND